MVWAVKWLLLVKGRRTKVVVDWHNFGYTILAMGLRPGHPLVAIAKYYERFFGRLADEHLCVTGAMRNWLVAEWGIKYALHTRSLVQ